MADRKDSIFAELSRRNVFRVGIAYVVASWLLLQVVDVLADILELPEWVPKFFLVVLAVGFILALIFAWAYEMTPEGLKREKDVDRSQSITGQTGKRLNRLTTVVLVTAVAFLLADKYVFDSGTPTTTDTLDSESAIVVNDSPSIAVLPFTNMSADEASGYFSDGLADTLLHMLAQVSDLRVAARTSSFQFRDQSVDVRDIGTQLNVSSVLEGSVQKAGNKIRVTAQLINVDDGYHLWSGNFDRELDDIFAIQDEIANEVVAALQVSLLGSEAERLQARATDNVDAYTEYMLGIDAMEQFSFESLPRAEQHFKRAIAIDPDYALAHARLAQNYVEMFDTGLIGHNALMQQARPAIDIAMSLDAQDPIALSVQGALLALGDDEEQAEVILRRAVRAGPNEVLPRMTLGRLLQYLDRPAEALDFIQQCLELDPLSVRALGRAASIHGELGNHAEARKAAQRVQAIDPQSPTGFYWQAFADWDDDRPVSAIRMMRTAAEIDPLDPELLIQIGDWYLDLGDFEAAEYWYRRSIEIDPEHPMTQTAIMYLDVIRGPVDGATADLARKLLDADIDNRKGSRELTLTVLFLDGHPRGAYGEYLERMAADYPTYFDDPPTLPTDGYPAQGARVAYALMQSGRTEQGRQLATSMLDVVRNRGTDNLRSLQGLHVAALLDDDAFAKQTLATTRNRIRFLDAWDFADHLFPWLGDYAQHPDYVALRAAFEEYRASRLARLDAELGRPPYDQ